MNTDDKRRFKHEIYEQFARIGKALSSPPRLELIDLLAQGERAVEELAEETGMSTANTSRHLQVLRRARLVRRRKEGNRAFYSLSGPDVFSAWRAVRELAEARLGDVREIVQQYLTDRDQLQGITSAEVAARLEEDDGVLVLDVRPSPAGSRIARVASPSSSRACWSRLWASSFWLPATGSPSGPWP